MKLKDYIVFCLLLLSGQNWKLYSVKNVDTKQLRFPIDLIFEPG